MIKLRVNLWPSSHWHDPSRALAGYHDVAVCVIFDMGDYMLRVGACEDLPIARGRRSVTESTRTRTSESESARLTSIITGSSETAGLCAALAAPRAARMRHVTPEPPPAVMGGAYPRRLGGLGTRLESDAP